MTLQTSSQPNHWTFRQVMTATLVVVCVAVAFWLFYRFSQVCFILFIAVVLGTVIRPAVTWLYGLGLPRIVGISLVYALLLIILIGFMLLVLPLIIEQGAVIAASLPKYYATMRSWILLYPNQLATRLGTFLPASLTDLIPAQQTGQEMLASAGQALFYFRSAFNVSFLTMVVLLLAFHWTLEGPRNIQSLLMLIANQQRDRMRPLISEMETKVGLYVAGQGFLCLIIAIMALVAYLVIGLPNALVLALIAGIMEAVPMVGPLLGAIPAAVIALSVSPSKLIWVIVASVIIQQIENSLLVPRVMRKAVGVNPFVSLLAIFAFSSLFGIAGALMAIPMAAILQILLERFVFHPNVVEAEVSEGRDYASWLRYTAQDLIQDLRKQARLKKGGSPLRVKQVDQVLDEIETITTDLDTLLAQTSSSGEL